MKNKNKNRAGSTLTNNLLYLNLLPSPLAQISWNAKSKNQPDGKPGKLQKMVVEMVFAFGLQTARFLVVVEPPLTSFKAQFHYVSMLLIN